MKRTVILFITLFLIVLSINSVDIHADNMGSTKQEIKQVFPDEVLAQIIADKLNKNVDDLISQRDLEYIYTLNINAEASIDLEGLQYLENVMGLSITNVTGLSSLDKLSNMSKLRNVFIMNSTLDSLEFIDNKANLESLDVYVSSIADTIPIKNVVSLKELAIYETTITDYTFLDTLDLINLTLSGTGLTSAETVLTKQTNLKKLDLSSNTLQGSLDFSALTQLTQLKLENNQISALDNVTSNLINLQISNNDGIELNNLNSLDKLERVEIKGSGLTQIPEIVSEELTHLNVSNNNIENVDSVEKYSNLESFQFSENKVTDIQVLENLSKLNHISASFNEVEKLPNFDLNEDASIYLNGNKITDISSLGSYKDSSLRLNFYILHQKSQGELEYLNSQVRSTLFVNDIDGELVTDFDYITHNGEVNEEDIAWDTLEIDETIAYKTHSEVNHNLLTVTHSVLVNHAYEAPKFVTVSFDSMGGNSIESQTILKGDVLGSPETPTRPHSIFKGWYYDNTFTTAWNAGDVIEDDTTLYAKWDNVIISSPIYIREGDSLDINSNLTNGVFDKIVGDSELYTYVNGRFTGIKEGLVELHFTNSWNQKEIFYIHIGALPDLLTISFETFGGSVVGPQSVVEGNSLNSSTIPNRSHSKFEGWYYEESYITAWDSEDIFLEDTVLYAKWSHTPIEKNINITIGENKTIKSVLTEGYLLEHQGNQNLFTYKDGVFTALQTGKVSLIFSNAWGQKETINITITEEVVKNVLVSFETIGGSIIEPISVEAGSMLESIEEPSRSNSIFEGWFYDIDYKKEWSSDHVITTDTVLYAKWGHEPIVREFYLNVGESVEVVTYLENGYLHSHYGDEETYSMDENTITGIKPGVVIITFTNDWEQADIVVTGILPVEDSVSDEKDNNDTGEQDTSEKDTSSTLPSTGISNTNVLLGSGVLLLSAGVILQKRRKKK